MTNRAASKLRQRTDIEHPSERVIEAVAAYSNTQPTELPRLYNSIDPDALDALFKPDSTTGRVQFQYAGYQVVLDTDGAIELTGVND